MTTATTGPAATLSRLAAPAAIVALLVALGALAMLAAGPIGWRAGWWNYAAGLRTLLPWSFFWGAGAVVLGLIAVGLAAIAGLRRSMIVAGAAIVIGGATASVPWHFNNLRGQYPPIDDITTDWTNPPQFVAAVPLRAAEDGNTPVYAGAAITAQQQKAYPDIAPLTLTLAPPQAFERARATAERMGWTIDSTDPAAGRIEAYQRSRWFGFADDIAIRVAAADGGSRVDIRSASRHGRGDFGVNAARIRAYLAALKADADGK